MSKTKPAVESLRRAEIRVDKTQSRAKIDTETLHDYADLIRDDVQLPPLVVFYDGEFYWLADGFHRCFAHQNLGSEFVDCEVHNGSLRDALQYSLGANVLHGLRRDNEDKRRAVEIAFSDSEWREWSDRAIAALCGVSHTFVATVRATSQVATDATCDKKPAKTRVGKDGKRQPVEKTKPQSAETSESFDPPPMPADPTPDERMAEWNRVVEAHARSITAIAEQAPSGGWWDESQANIVAQQLKSAAGSARQAKCDNICPMCKGKGCKRCKQTGFMPRRTYEMAGGK